jgi:hypothetical protein
MLKKLAVLGLTAAAFSCGILVEVVMHSVSWTWWMLVGPACFASGTCFAVWQVGQMD